MDAPSCIPEQTCSNTTDENLSTSQNDATPARDTVQDTFLPWAVVGACGLLSISVIISNFICLLAILIKRCKHSSNAEIKSGCSNAQNLTYDSVQDSSGDQNYSIYENNPVYGQSPGSDQPFDLESNPSYKATGPSKDQQFTLQMNPSYRQIMGSTIETEPEYRNLTASYTVEEVDGYVNC